MRCYLVTNNTTIPPTKQYAGTQADAATTKKEAMAAGAKRKDIEVAEVEVPVGKDALIAFLNDLIKTG